MTSNSPFEVITPAVKAAAGGFVSVPRPILISLDGGISSGKSTLLQHLRALNISDSTYDFTKLHFIDEPLDTWTSLKNESGDNLLEVFYRDNKRWSYTFQNCAVLSRFLNIRKAIEAWYREVAVNPDAVRNNIFITERCLETDYNVFAQMLREDGCIDGIEWELYKKWYVLLQDTVRVSAIVYVNTPADVCAERIIKRGRQGEESIPMEYLTRLHHFHQKWIDRITVPVLQYKNYKTQESKKVSAVSDVLDFVRDITKTYN
jgi:deoxyadenosine/deoxycytidine kinase